MVSIGRHPNWGTRPPLGRLGHPSRLKIGETLASFQLQRGSNNIRDGHIDIGGEQTRNKKKGGDYIILLLAS